MAEMMAKLEQIFERQNERLQQIFERQDKRFNELFPQAELLAVDGSEKPDETKTVPPAVPPRFDDEDLETWCGQATQFFDYYGTPDHQRFSICSYHMYGKARVWFRELNATQSVSRWDELVKAIKARFSVPEEMDNEEKLKNGAEEKKGDEEEKRDEILPEIDPNEAPKYTIFSETDPKHTVTPESETKFQNIQILLDEIPPQISESLEVQQIPDRESFIKMRRICVMQGYIQSSSLDTLNLGCNLCEWLRWCCCMRIGWTLLP
jgi:hypothetical protein